MNKPVAPQPPGQAEITQPSLSDRFPRIAKFFKLLKYFILSSIILTVMEIGFGYWLSAIAVALGSLLTANGAWLIETLEWPMANG